MGLALSLEKEQEELPLLSLAKASPCTDLWVVLASLELAVHQVELLLVEEGPGGLFLL